MTTTTTTTGSGTVLVDGRPWWALAACRLVGDPEIFYPLDLDPTGPAVRAARRVCAHCPVLPECLSDVMASEDPARRWGVIGGMTPDERTTLHARCRVDAVSDLGEVA